LIGNETHESTEIRPQCGYPPKLWNIEAGNFISRYTVYHINTAVLRPGPEETKGVSIGVAHV
jgi:hypothetical protein